MEKTLVERVAHLQHAKNSNQPTNSFLPIEKGATLSKIVA